VAADRSTNTTEPSEAKRKNLPKRKFKLTDRGLQALKPAEPGARYTVWDTEAAGSVSGSPTEVCARSS
jgi:hypothetical protein